MLQSTIVHFMFGWQLAPELRSGGGVGCSRVILLGGQRKKSARLPAQELPDTFSFEQNALLPSG